MLKAVIEVPYPSASHAKKARKALEQETAFKKRSRTTLGIKGENLKITIQAEDLVALHATANSYLRLLKIISATMKKAEGD